MFYINEKNEWNIIIDYIYNINEMNEWNILMDYIYKLMTISLLNGWYK